MEFLMKVFYPFIAVTLLITALQTKADESVNNPIEVRKSSMKALGKSMKTLGPIYTQKRPFNADVVKEATDRLLDYADSMTLLHLFPEGSLSDDSKSKPDIWDNWNEFSNMMLDFEKNVSDFGMVVGMGLEASAVEFKHITESCSDCHKKYRTKRK